MELVTGGTGFLGSHLVHALLQQGHRVRLLCRRPPQSPLYANSAVEWHLGDLTEPATLASACRGIRRLYHVAGLVDFNPRTPHPMLATNEFGTRHLLQAAKQAGVERVVHVSSVSTIGAVAQPDQQLTEVHFGQGLGLDIPYPQSKFRGELVALEFAAAGFPVVIVNPTFFIGPYDVNLSSARTLVSFVQRQLWMTLNRGGMGVTDVRDVVQGMLLAMERGVAGERYILGGQNVTLRQYHSLLAQLTGLSAPKIRIPPWLAIKLIPLNQFWYGLFGKSGYLGQGDIQLAQHYWFYDYSKAQHQLGLQVRPLVDSLRDTLAWLASAGFYTPLPEASRTPAARPSTKPHAAETTI